MERFCVNCGKAIEEGVQFCTECGEPAAPLPEDAVNDLLQAEKPAVPEEIVKEAEPKKPQPAVSMPVAAPPAAAAAPEGITVFNKPMSTAAFFWTLLLFGIPVIGLIAMLIMAFAAKNSNRKSFAQACLIWVLIGLILLGIFMLILVVTGKSFGIDISKFSFKAIWEGIMTGIGFAK